MPVERIQWTCPICKRRYAIPATAPTPSRCPQCRQAAEDAAAQLIHAPVLAEAIPEPVEQANEPIYPAPPLSALAAIQMEVAEEASRGPATPIPVSRYATGGFDWLGTIAVIYTVLAGLAVVGGFAGLLFGLRSAFVLEATPARTFAILYALGAFVGGLVLALTFFAFREVIRLLLTIEENTRA